MDPVLAALFTNVLTAAFTHQSSTRFIRRVVTMSESEATPAGNIVSSVAGAGVTQIIDVVDQTSAKALEAVVALENAAVVSVQGAITVGDKTFDAAVEEVEKSRAAFIDALRKVADAVIAPIEAIS
jgi:hypothetical protein